MSREPLNLEGWEDLSVWGWDDEIGSYYAQLYTNDADDEEPPKIWLTPPPTHYRTKEELASAIAAATNKPIATIEEAMGIEKNKGATK